jgi:hypothetical protein
VSVTIPLTINVPNYFSFQKRTHLRKLSGKMTNYKISIKFSLTEKSRFMKTIY